MGVLQDHRTNPQMDPWENLHLKSEEHSFYVFSKVGLHLCGISQTFGKFEAKCLQIQSNIQKTQEIQGKMSITLVKWLQ